MNTIVEHINSAGHAFVEFALPMLIQSSVLIVILLLLDLLLRKKVKAVFRYWIWMLVLLKLILPTSLSSPLSLGYLFGEKLTYQDLAQSSPRLEPTMPAPANISPVVDTLYIRPNPYISPPVPATSVVEPVVEEQVKPPEVPVTPLSWQGVVFLVWLAVVIAMGLLLLQRALFVRGLVAQAKKAGRLMNDALSYCCASMGIKSKVGLRISVNATTPSVCGLIRPVILVPWKLTSTLGASRLRTILMHELAHIKRGDLWVNLVQTALQIIYFYNPLLWLANFVIRRIREQAVDEAVLVAMGEKAQKYPQTLVDVAKMAFKRPALGLRLIGVVESKSALAGRIKHILGRPIPKSARLGIVSVLSILITAAVLLPMARAREAAFAGQGGPLNIRLAGVRPDGSDDIYDGRGKKIAENTFANIAKEWGEDQQHRTFIFELPKTEEPILFPPFLKIKPAGKKRVFGTGQHPFLYYSDGKLRYSVYTSLPRTYKKVFERQVKKVDLILPYYYGQRGAADFVFTGPFTPGQTVKAEGDADCELTPKEDLLNFGNHPTAFFRISSETRFDGDFVLIYDTSGRRYFLETVGGRGGSGFTDYNYRAEGLTLNSIACVTVGEKPYEATFKNVVVSYPDRPVPERLEFLDEMCERLDLTGFSGDRLLNNYTFENPADAVKVIDIVHGYRYVMKVFRAIRYSDSGIELSNLDSQAQQKVRSAVTRWAKAGHPRVREMGIRLGLVGGWPEFMDMALDCLEQDVVVYDMLGRAYRGLEKEAKEQIAVEVASYPIALNSEQAERLKKIILSTDSPRLGMRLFRIFWRADEDLIFHTCWDLAQDDRPWIWWPAMYSLSNRGNKKLRPFENLPEKIQKRLILVRKAGGSSRLFDVSSSGKDYETVVKEAYAMLPAMFTARLARMNGRTCNDVRQVMAKHLDREIAAKAMTDFLRDISIESNQRLWAGDSYYFGTCCSTAYCIARHINSLYDVNIDSLGKYETREKSGDVPRNISQLKQLIASTLKWYDARSGAGNKSGIAAEVGMADKVEEQLVSLDHFVGRYALAAHPETAAFEITKKGDVFIFRDLGGPKFEIGFLLKGLEGRRFEMEKGRDNLKFGNNPRQRYSVRYNPAEGRYILDGLGMRGRVQDGFSSPLTDLVKISAEKPGDIFAATLPNGVTVELMGVCQLPGQDKQWWAADGSLLEDIFWEGSTANRESSADARQVVFRVRSDESDPALAPTVSLHPKRRLQPPGSWSGAFFVKKDNQTLEEFRGCSFSLHDDQKSIDISANIGYGPWKTLTKLATNSEISLPKPVFTDIGYITWNEPTEEGDKTTVSATLFDGLKVWRIVAVDKQGDIYVSSTALGHGFDGHQIAKSTFSLPLSRIEKFRFQTRPLGEIIFKNVSLEPNFKTKVQVEVEEAEPVLADVIEAVKTGVSLPIRKIFSGKSDKGGSFEWETSFDPRVRFRHGWYTVVNGVVRHHVGAGGSQIPQEGKLNLKLDVEVKDKMLNLKVQRVHDLDDDGRTAAVAGKTSVPAGAYLKHDSSIDSAVMSNKHLTLWQGDFIRDGKVVKSVIYAAYLTNPDDWETGFKPPVLQKAEIVTAKVGPDVRQGIEETISPKLVMLLMVINSCAPETDLNIDSVSITARSISIEGDTSTLKFLVDTIEKNELEISHLSLYTKDGRDKFSIAVEPKENWQQWWQQHETDVKLGLEENISPKLVMLLGAIADCAAGTELNIESVSIKAGKIDIKGGTSSRTNTLKFLDAVKKNELEVLRLNYVTRDDRNKFSITAQPKENWRQWWQKHKADIEAEIPAEEEVASKLSQLKHLLAKPPIVAYDVKLNFADPTARDGSFHSEQSVAFLLSFHNIEIGPAEKFTLGHLLIGQTTWPVHLEENGIAIHEGVSGQKIKSLKWPAGEPRFDKVIKIPVKYGNREYSCPVRVDLDRYNKDAPTGAYWFCAYLSGRLPWGAGGRGFEIVNLDQQMEFRLTGDGTDPRDAVLGIDINGDGRIDPAIAGGEQFDLYEPFQIGSKTYQLAEVDPYLPRVVFRELDARMLPHQLAKADVPVEEGKGSSEIAEGTPIYKKTIRFTGVVTKIMEFNPSGNHETFAVEDDPRFILFLQVTAADPQNYWFQPGRDVDFLIHDPVVLFGGEQEEVVGKSYCFVMGEDVKSRFRLLSVKPLAAKPKSDVRFEFEGPSEENQVIWGKPSQGVQVGINVEKEKWRIGGDVPRLNVEVRVSDPKKFRESGLTEKAMAHDWSAFAVEIDGKQYKHNVFYTTEPGQLRSPFKIPLFLDDEWQGGPGLNPGRHKIRVLFVGLGMKVASEPVEIEVLPDDKKLEPWPYLWGKAVKGVQVGAHPARPSWTVGSEPVIRICLRNQGKEKWSIHEAPSSFALEVDGKRYENNFIFRVWRRPFAPGDTYQFDLKLSKSKPFHDGLRKGNVWPPIGKPPSLLPGKHTVRVLFTELRIEPEPASLPVEFEIVPAGSDVYVEAEPGGATSGLVWGKQVNGLRAALEFVPQKKSYSLGDRVGIRFHVQNVSVEPVQFISDTWRQNDRATIEDEDGKRQPVNTAWYSDWTAVDRYYLKPGEKAVVESSAFGIAANNEQADDLGYPVGYTLVCVPGIYSVGFSVRIPNASTSSLPPQADDWEGVLQTGKHRLVVTAASGPDQLSAVPVEVEKPVVGKWEDVGKPIPADFNDTIALTEQITLSSIGQDVEGKTFITFVRDKEKDRNRLYRFVLIKKNGTVLEPDSHLIFDENGTLEEKFTFDEPYVSWRLKEFKFQSGPLSLAATQSISSQLKKDTSTAFEGKTISPSGLAPPGRYAIELDGVDDYLFVPDSPTLRLEPPFTVEMWIKPKLPEQKPDRLQQWGVIAQGGYIGTGRAKTRGFGIELTRFEKEPATFQICYTEANDNGLFGKDYGNYRFDEWMHISHVFEGENYKPSHGLPLVIGRFLIPVPEPFMGQIGEVRIWNGARTREEIRRYKNRALTGKEPGLAACWTFEQAEGQFAYDMSGNNNHARLGKAVEADGADPKWVDLEAAAHQPGRIANVPIEVEGIAKDEIGRLSEVGERRTIPERRKGRIEFFGLDLTDAPHTTKSADLPDLFEERPPGSKSYEIASGVTVIYGGFEGTVYYISEKDVFYIQQDKLGSSTMTYYGPFNGDPQQVLDRQIDVSIKAEEAGASSGDSESAVNEDGPRIKFESLVCDLGQVAPNTKYLCEFKYTNTGSDVLKITRVGVACACTAPQKTRECAPGESGTLKVTYRTGARAGKVKKNVYVYSNDKVNPKIALTIKAEIVIRVAHEPKKLNLVLDKENAGCPAVTLTSLDNKPFSITSFKSTGDSITADFDSSVKETSLVVRPKVDMEKLGKGMRGQINVSLDHPECKRITVSFETLTKFKVDPRIVYVREAEPQKPITKKVRILSNYSEDFEIESTSSKNGNIKVLAQEKVRDGYQFELQITPPEQESKRRVFTDVFTVELKGDQKFQITCYGIYSRKSAETAGESLPKSDVHLEVAQSGGDSVYGSGDIVVVSEGKSKVYGSIQKAIDAAPAGSIVRIGPGVYKERLEIDKPLTLEGAGWDRTTIVTKNNTADAFEEAISTFRKRILEAKSEEHAKKLSAELQAQFEAEMKENMAAQTHLVSDTKNVVIRNLKLTSPGRHLEGRALSVPIIKFSNTGALISGCAVVGTPGDGIHVVEGSDVQIRDSLVAGVWSTGIAVAPGRGDIAKASIINCDVRNCHHRGITIGPGCDSTVVRGCRISGSSWHGIRYDNASPTIIGNLIFANVRCGIYASGRTEADVRQNLFYGNEMSGISCWFKNQDKIEANTFVANMRSGLEVLGASKPIVRKNIFYANPTAVFCGNIGDDSPSATSDGTVNLEENLFWGFEYKVAWRHPGEAKDEVVTEEVKLDEKTRNVVFDPEFKDITAEDFSLKLDSPARRPGIGAVVLIDYKSPWPLQDEEIHIIPEDKTEDTSWMGQISSTGKIVRPIVVPVASKGGVKLQESIEAKPGKQEGSEHPGRISGVVVNSDTGDPIVGAYVGVGDFGDSGGSNYSRHRSQGFHDKTKTDAEGRFELGGLVFTDKHRYLKYHPLVVTHPDFVRHDRNIELPSDGPAPDVKVNLMPAAKIEVTIVDADGNPLPGQWLLRLEALDGRRFIPPGSDPHLSSFASDIWAHWPDLRKKMGISQGFTFTELDTGEYSIEALKFQLVDKPSPGNIWEPTITYHGSIPSVRVQAGQAKQVRLAPQDHQTRLTITHPEYPDKLMDKLERSSQMPLMCLISRSPGALLWDDGKIRHLEDQRLGRIDQKRFFRGFFLHGKPLTIDNLPPDSYSLFAIAVYGQVAGCLIGARVDLAKGDKVTLDIPWRQPTGPSMVGPNRSFDYPVNLEATDYNLSELCEILTSITQSNPRIIADPSIENEKLSFGKGEMSVWDVLEKLYLDKGWRLEEGQEKTLIIKPAHQTDVHSNSGQDESNSLLIVSAVDNKAALTSGAMVELLGLTYIPVAEDLWWRTDGSPLPKAPFHDVSFTPSVDPNWQQFAYYTVAMQIKGKLPREIGLLKWDFTDAVYAGTTSAYANEKRVYYDNIHSGAVKFPKAVKRTKLRLGIVSGDWQILVKGSHYGFYRKGKDSINVGTPESGGLLGVHPGEKGLHIGVTYNVTDRDFRVVAVDKDGKVHVSARSGSSGTENLRRTTASFPDLTRDKLREYRFQTRPYEWVEFKDVSLRPSEEAFALAGQRRVAKQKELEKWLGQGKERQIREQILILRESRLDHINEPCMEQTEAISAMRELVRIGEPAVPELTTELRQAEHWLEKSLIAFVLRAIGNEYSVPALIEVLVQSKYRGGYGIYVKDDKLAEFMLDNQYYPPDESERKVHSIIIACPVIEITKALEKITEHSEGPDRFSPEVAEVVKSRWRKWWEDSEKKIGAQVEVGPGRLSAVTDLPGRQMTESFHIPPGLTNVALNKTISSSDPEPIIGEIEMITDGDRTASAGSYVELHPSLQYVTIDLEEVRQIHAISVWHYQQNARVYFDVVVQVADDPDFTAKVRTVFNNDIDNSAGLGFGKDMHYVETNEGKLIDCNGVEARYIRLYSRGNTRDNLNHYVEIEVYAKSAGTEPARPIDNFIENAAISSEDSVPEGSIASRDVLQRSKIAFVSRRDGNREIYLMNTDGSDQKNLTSNPAEDRGPSWSPDGRKIAFWSKRDGNGEVYVMNVDGSEQRNLTNHPAGDGGYCWSPDGKKIAFVRDGKNGHRNSEIFVMNADGTDQQQLTNSPAPYERPSWSPDGTKLVLASDFEIYIMNVDGSGRKRLTDNDVYDGSLAWSPDGKRIAFSSSNSDGKSILCVMNADGSEQQRMVNCFGMEVEPSWAPDGKRIAVVLECIGEGFEAYVMDFDGSGQRRLTKNRIDEFGLSWSWDGRKIAFTGIYPGRDEGTDRNLEIYAVDFDGRNQINLTNNPAHDEDPAWSPILLSGPQKPADRWRN